MSFPETGTFDIPCISYELAAAAASARTVNNDAVLEFVAGARGDTRARPGHVCVNAWILTRDLQHVLLVNHPRFGWTIPGGHLNPGEPALDAARREIAEETGLHPQLAEDRPVGLLVGTIPARGDDPEHTHYVLTYAFTAAVDDELTCEPGQPAQWFPTSEPLPEGRFGDNWLVHDVIANLRCWHCGQLRH